MLCSDVKFLPLKEKEKVVTEIILITVALRRRRMDLMGSERTSASIKGLNKNLKVTQEMRGRVNIQQKEEPRS